jgi:hypothetical protein
MIRPDRYTNPDFSVINISATILSQLAKQPQISYDTLLAIVIDKIGKKAKENYPYALNFLYLLGKLDYNAVDDTFQYLKNEAE